MSIIALTLLAVSMATLLVGAVAALGVVARSEDVGPEWLLAGHPANLAVFRVAVFTAITVMAVRSPAVPFSELPEVFLAPPFGWGWILELIPPEPTTVGLGRMLLVATGTLAILGVFSQWTTLAAALLSIWVLGVPQFYGKIDHYHHLIWFALLLAVSPCGDALSVDRIRANRCMGRRAWAAPAPCVDYGVPLQFTWALMGIAYFFPGLWKLLLTGPGWLSGEILPHQLWLKWFEVRWMPPLRIDQHRLLAAWSTRLVVLFELSFIVLVFQRWARPLLALGGLAFHNSTRVLMRIPFWSLQICYVALIDWYRVWIGLRGEPERAATPSAGGWRPAARVGLLLVLINGMLGLVRIDTWPFTVYPTFAFTAPPTARVLEVEAFTGGSVSRSRFGQGRLWSFSAERSRRLVLGLLADSSTERLSAFWRLHEEFGAPVSIRADSVRFWSMVVSTRPGEVGRVVSAPELVRTICPGRPTANCPPADEVP